MASDKKALKKIFPNLYEELEGGNCKVPINALRKNAAEAEESEDGETQEEDFKPTFAPDKFCHFSPSAVDFIRRCDTDAQAEEIITYLQKKGEITKEYADELRCKVKRDGVRCFGPKKEENYYFREGGIF
jgi:hypothetical protein